MKRVTSELADALRDFLCAALAVEADPDQHRLLLGNQIKKKQS
jgi:hypothetical protein